ncbi:MAG: NTP transferase domain-containing protein [Saprospiraceae bacterium]|nr:NTP transferase domain-containing protein [Saprospiraceae bacterium]
MLHTKHTNLTRPALGRFGRNEWAFVGTSCGKIQQLARQLIAAMSDRYQCAYLDADHTGADADTALPGALAAGATLEYTDAIHSHLLRVQANWGIHQFRRIFNEADLILVNGNHHEAAAQVVVIDPAKENSLRKRMAQLTDVRLILLAEGVEQVFDFVENTLPDADKIPRLHLSDHAGILRFFEREMSAKLPPVNGLVLAGGRSLRMGRDKGAIAWHGKPQREFAADLLKNMCAEVFISCRPGQEAEMGTTYPTLPDTFADLGPYGAILSAFRQSPNTAWLVVACDLPLLDEATLRFLLENRQPRRVATTFESPFDQMPEPLITLWEPKSYAVLLSFLAQGYSCPRKVLINSDTLVLQAPRPEALTNVNTPEEAEKIGMEHR